jgi:hypothetical protein
VIQGYRTGRCFGDHLEQNIYIKFLNIRHCLGTAIFKVYVAFIIVIVEFYKMGTTRFDVTCQLIPLLQLNKCKLRPL